jgi:hypothetical protein
MPLYFRYPFGAMTPSKEQILKEEGYLDGGIGWDVDTLDWDFGSDGHASRPEVPAQFRDDFEGWITHQTDRRGGGVILLHDVQSITANNIDNIIMQLKMRGFSFGELPRERRSPIAPGSGNDSDDPVECRLGNGQSGRCIPQSECSGTSTSGLCPGPASIQCCT